MKREASTKHASKSSPTVVRKHPIKPCHATRLSYSLIHRHLTDSLIFLRLQVIKVGTSSLIRPEKNCLNLTSLASIVETVRDLKNEGYNVVLVSSGAVGVGCQRLGLATRPSELAKK